jgi:hypothetical protein
MLTWVDESGKLKEAKTPSSSGVCEENGRLMEALLAAIHDVSVILNQQMQAVIDGDTEFSRFDVLLHYAQEKKNRAKYAWLSHVEMHQCGE